MRRNLLIIFLAFFMLFFMNLGEVFSSTVDAESGEKKVSAPEGFIGLQPPSLRVEEDELLDFLVRRANLRIYAGGTGQFSCNGDSDCELIRSLVCLKSVCEGKNRGKEPTDCFPDISETFNEKEQKQINSLSCQTIVRPSRKAREVFLSRVPKSDESFLVESGAMILAMKGDAEACRNYFLEYFGPLSQDYKLHRFLVGCSILSGENTLEEANQDYRKWMEVILGKGQCSAINNIALQKVCEEAVPDAGILPK